MTSKEKQPHGLLKLLASLVIIVIATCVLVTTNGKYSMFLNGDNKYQYMLNWRGLSTAGRLLANSIKKKESGNATSKPDKKEIIEDEMRAELKRRLGSATNMKIDDERTGALVFHFHAISEASMPPKSKRNSKQLHIFWDRESTATLRGRGKSLDFEDKYEFNATMTYRRDSDFYNGYDDVLLSDIVSQNKLSLEEILMLKTKTAVAVISNCGYTPGAKTRMAKVEEIIALGFALDGYGSCFHRKIANGKDRKSPEFYEEVRKYKFYFSFENSFHCKEYITEKLFNNALVSKSVPVVWGGNKRDYEAVAPPGSFIYAEDFPNLADLVKYLNYLDNNSTAYMEYLRWLEMDPSTMPMYGRARGLCAICRALHGINIDDIHNPNYNATNTSRPIFTDGVAERTIPSLKNWFYGEESSDCY